MGSLLIVSGTYIEKNRQGFDRHLRLHTSIVGQVEKAPVIADYELLENRLYATIRTFS